MLIAKEVLKTVVDCFNQGGPESQYLWDVLTALRGPDSVNEELKMKTTVHIRRRIGMTPVSGIWAVTHTDEEQMTSREAYNTPGCNEHFANHYRWALEALSRMGYSK